MTGYAWLLMLAAMLVSASQSQTGTVTGQLLNDRGLPAVGVRVAAMPVPREGGTSVPTLIGLTLTDSNGRYTLEMIEPGTYYVTAGRIDAPAYYPGVVGIASAKSILVTAGARITGVDFKFQPLIHTVSGRVVLPPEQKLMTGSRMTLAGSTRLEASINPDGTFEFRDVPTGQYTLRLSRDPFSSVAVTVEDRVTGIEFRPGAVSVNASLVMEDGAAAAPNTTVSFRSLTQNRAWDVRTTGSFFLYAPEDEYRVTASVRNGYQVKSLIAGDVDLLTNSLKLSSTAPAVAITLTLKAASLVTFRGRAVSPQGVLQQVRTIRMEGREGTEPVQGAVRFDGSFAFDEIPPGEYTAVVSLSGSQAKVRVSVPPEGNSKAEIVLPDLRQMAARLTIEANVPASANPVVTLRFVDTAGESVPLTIDGSSRETPLKFSLREGQYRVTATIRESGAAADRTQVKTLTSGAVDLLTSPLNVGRDVEEIRITVGR